MATSVAVSFFLIHLMVLTINSMVFKLTQIDADLLYFVVFINSLQIHLKITLQFALF